jgi:hypothetical protein
MYLEGQTNPASMHSGESLVKLDAKLQIAMRTVRLNTVLTRLTFKRMG